MNDIISKSYVSLLAISHKTINNFDYVKSEYIFNGNNYGVLSAFHEQRDDINRGVSREEGDNQDAGGQGIMLSAIRSKRNCMLFDM